MLVDSQHRELLSSLLRSMNATVVSIIPCGGSSATVARVQCEDQAFAAKFLIGASGWWVDGHDLHAFRQKVQHQLWLRSQSGAVSTIYPEIIDHQNGPDWSYVVMRWWEGASLIDEIGQHSLALDRFSLRLRRTLDFLAREGYSSLITLSPPIYAAETYLARVQRRIQYLARTELSPLVAAQHLVVNGVACRAPLAILSSIAESSRLQAAIHPARLFFPLHGDLNLRNMLIGPQFDHAADHELAHHFQLLDPRGAIAPWDILYDLGKMCFSVSIFEALLASAFRVEHSVAQGRAHIRIQDTVGWTHRFGEMLSAFHHVLEQPSQLRLLLEDAEPDWQARLLFVHACHVLAEAACRVSAQTRSGTLRGSGPSRRSLDAAAILYAIGALLLNQWYIHAQAGEHQQLLDLTQLLQRWLAAPTDNELSMGASR